MKPIHKILFAALIVLLAAMFYVADLNGKKSAALTRQSPAQKQNVTPSRLSVMLPMPNWLQ